MSRKSVAPPEPVEEDMVDEDVVALDAEASSEHVPQIGESIVVEAHFIGRRLDQYLTEQLAISRARVQMLLEQAGITVDGKSGHKPSMKLRGGETIAILAAPEPPPLRATPEDIPLEFIYEDDDLAVINKPPGMMVHAGAGNSSAGSDEMLDDPRQSGTLVNALLHHLQKLSTGSAPLRPGIVHRLDKNTSGLMLVAKNDDAHAKLSEMFAKRHVKKTYIALVQGTLKQPTGTINTPIARDAVRRTRMTTRRELALQGTALHRRSLWQVHADRGADRDRADAPDPRTHVVDRASGGGGYPLRRAGEYSAAGHTEQEGQEADGRGAGEGVARAQLPACGEIAAEPSADG